MRTLATKGGSSEEEDDDQLLYDLLGLNNRDTPSTRPHSSSYRTPPISDLTMPQSATPPTIMLTYAETDTPSVIFSPDTMTPPLSRSLNRGQLPSLLKGTFLEKNNYRQYKSTTSVPKLPQIQSRPLLQAPPLGKSGIPIPVIKHKRSRSFSDPLLERYSPHKY